ncbi:MAG: dCTP deaminase [Candidatus Altiarchaeota archaeon]|nr:dCTP deaminase [Candidatus Altiarchaeota archaeon]
MILGRSEILKLVKEKKLIEGFNEGCLEGAGYDLRVGNFYRIEGSAHLGKETRKLPDAKEIKSEGYNIKPGEYILVKTMEKVNMPNDVAARVLNRSSVFRSGCNSIHAFVDPGFTGNLTFGFQNIGANEFVLEKGAKIAQIIFEEVKGETKPYNGRYQGGKVV